MKEDQHFKVVDRATWDILFQQYGGNVVPRISVAVETEDPLRPDYIVEIQHRTFEIVTYPKVKYFQESLVLDARVSRADTVKELVHKLCESIDFQKVSRKRDKSVELQELCRIWKFEGQDTFADCQQAIEMVRGDTSKLPVQVHARLLLPHELIQDANIADSEQLVFEWRINMNFNSETPWAFDPKNEKRKRKNLKSKLP